MFKNILVLFQLLFICLLAEETELKWCQDEENEKIIHCYSFNDYQTHFVDKGKECKQNIFHMKEKRIVFNEGIFKDDVKIDCEKNVEIHIQFMSEKKENNVKRRENDKIHHTEKNSTLKGYVSNCEYYSSNSYCWDYCIECYGGYRLSGYHSHYDSSGYYQCSGYDYCYSCSSGTYSSGSSTSCSSCSPGTYQPYSGYSYCFSCSAGSYSNSGATSCSSCPTGTYQPNSGQGSCISCASGKYNPNS